MPHAGHAGRRIHTLPVRAGLSATPRVEHISILTVWTPRREVRTVWMARTPQIPAALRRNEASAGTAWTLRRKVAEHPQFF